MMEILLELRAALNEMDETDADPVIEFELADPTDYQISDLDLQ